MRKAKWRKDVLKLQQKKILNGRRRYTENGKKEEFFVQGKKQILRTTIQVSFTEGKVVLKITERTTYFVDHHSKSPLRL